MPWQTAAKRYTAQDNGLIQPWEGRVWLNPPYGREIDAWMEKMALHRNGIALTFARTETVIWHQHIWPIADAILFIRGRLNFHKPDGTRAKANAGAPSALIAYGIENANRLNASGIATASSFRVGTAVTVNSSGITVVGVVTATSFVGSGANLTGVISGVEIKNAGTSVGTGITNINFVGATATATGSASTITITATSSFNELDVALFS